jgi:hypothetical protein
MGLKIMSKSKNRPMKWQFFHENHQLGKVVEMKGTNDSFVPVGFSRIRTERLKNWSGKCEGPGGGDPQIRTGVGNVMDRPGGIHGLKNRSEKCDGPAKGDRRVKEPEWEMRRTGQGGSTG